MLRRAAVLLAVLTMAPPVAGAATLNVANNGVDSPACGDKSDPCRSIGQAIQNAAAGDKISVGPGLYGDLDGDGAFDGDGEEAGEVDTGCDCLIHVDKELTVISTAGRGATVIDANNDDLHGVRLGAAGAAFGAKGKGFTVMGADRGLTGEGLAGPVEVVGNRFLGHEAAGVFLRGAQHEVSDNQAFDNDGAGFNVEGVLEDNTAIDNNGGFRMPVPGGEASGNLAASNGGFGFEADGAVLEDNVAVDNLGVGFDVAGSAAALSGNLAVGNRLGINLTGDTAALEKNAAIGNLEAGLRVEEGAEPSELSDNSFYGNGEAPSIAPQPNCGLLSEALTDFDATGNYWGAATGPGVNPADDVCIDNGGTFPVSAPFATKEKKVKAKVAQ